MKLIAVGTLALALTANIAQPRTALAWGDEGHQVVGLIAQSYLDADVRKRVNALLAADTDDLTSGPDQRIATLAGARLNKRSTEEDFGIRPKPHRAASGHHRPSRSC